MHRELKTFFETHQAGTAVCTRKAHDGLVPVQDLADDVDTHLRDLESKLTRAELAPHDATLNTRFEWMHTRLRAARQRLDSLRSSVRELARCMTEVDQGFNEDFLALSEKVPHAIDASSTDTPSSDSV